MHKTNAFFHDCARVYLVTGCGGGGGGEVYYAGIGLRTAVRVVRVHLESGSKYKPNKQENANCAYILRWTVHSHAFSSTNFPVPSSRSAKSREIRVPNATGSEALALRLQATEDSALQIQPLNSPLHPHLQKTSAKTLERSSENKKKAKPNPSARNARGLASTRINQMIALIRVRSPAGVRDQSRKAAQVPSQAD